MSKISLSPNVSGTGTFTIASPNSSTDRTLTLPDQTGTVLTGSGAIGVNASAPTSSVNIDSSGNVGIGTTSPTNKLTIGGTNSNIFFKNADATTGYAAGQIANTGGSFYFGLTSSTGAFWQNTAGNYAATIGTSNATNLSFATNDNVRMLIDSSGNVLVGTTSALGGTGKIQIANGTGRAINTIGSSGDLSIEPLRIGKFDNNSTTSQVFVKFTINNDGAGSGQINANGASAAAFGAFSDRRLKENITDLPSQLNNIMALRPVEFDYIESEGGGHQIGFIAQEVQDVYPDLIGEREDGMLTLTDMNKNDARLIKCIQEQQTIIETLKADIAELKAKVNV